MDWILSRRILSFSPCPFKLQLVLFTHRNIRDCLLQQWVTVSFCWIPQTIWALVFDDMIWSVSIILWLDFFSCKIVLGAGTAESEQRGIYQSMGHRRWWGNGCFSGCPLGRSWWYLWKPTKPTRSWTRLGSWLHAKIPSEHQFEAHNSISSSPAGWDSRQAGHVMLSRKGDCRWILTTKFTICGLLLLQRSFCQTPRHFQSTCWKEER